jgi:hypothetical protein
MEVPKASPRVFLFGTRPAPPYYQPMVSKLHRIWLAGLLAPLAFAASARAEGILFPGARPLGAGGGMRAVATGDAGPMLNPSGISLMRSYAIEGGYQYGKAPDSHDMRLSIVDSTSGFNLGGALYYSYHRDSPQSGVTQTGHVAGGSLSFPFLDKIYLGTNLKYVRFDDALTRHSGFTFDAGMTVRPMPQLSLGAVAYNVFDHDTSWVPRGYGGGVAVLPFPALLLVFDAASTKVYGDATRDQALQLMGGGELSLGTTAAVRAGGGHDGLTRNAYVAAGVTLLMAELGALDVGLRQDVSGDDRTTIVGASVRLFVPAP